jgi:hypothetical protein
MIGPVLDRLVAAGEESKPSGMGTIHERPDTNLRTLSLSGRDSCSRTHPGRVLSGANDDVRDLAR